MGQNCSFEEVPHGSGMRTYELQWPQAPINVFGGVPGLRFLATRSAKEIAHFSRQQELELSEAQLSDIVQEFENELRRILDRPPPEED